MSSRPSRPISWMGGLLVLCLVSAAPAASREIVHSLFTAAEAAEVIVVGSVVSRAGDRVTASSDTVMKGAVSGSEIQVRVVQRPRLRPRVSYDPGASFLFFLVHDGGDFVPLPGRGSVVPLDASKQEALRNVLDYLAAGSEEAKTATLAGMLDGANRVSQREALGILLRGRHHGDYAGSELLASVRTLVRSQDREIAAAAVQALVLIGDRTVIVDLIDALGATDPTIADLAHGLLVRVTGQSFPLDARLTPEEREPAIQLWRDWWSDNRETAPLLLQ